MTTSFNYSKILKIKEMYSSLIKEEKLINDEVIDFCIDNSSYYVVTQKGRILNIIKCIHLQPKIKDENDYYAYLLVEAKEGFFLFKQNIKNKKVKKWILEKELIPKEELDFFKKYVEEFTISREEEV